MGGLSRYAYSQQLTYHRIFLHSRQIPFASYAPDGDDVMTSVVPGSE